MRHIAFPTQQDVQAFQQDLVSQGLAAPTLGRATVTRSAAPVSADLHGGTPEDAGAGAIKGTEAGLVVGAAAGVLTTAGVLGAAAATAATVATGGLALPVILGMAALGAGVGAAVGGVGGAAGVDETHGAGDHAYEVDDARYDTASSRVDQGHHVVAVDDSIPGEVLQATAGRHGGQLV